AAAHRPEPTALRPGPRIAISGMRLAAGGVPGRGGAPLVHSSPFAPVPVRGHPQRNCEKPPWPSGSWLASVGLSCPDLPSVGNRPRLTSVISVISVALGAGDRCRTDADRRRREIDDAPEQLIVLAPCLRPEQRIGVTGERGIDRFPVPGSEM